MSTTIKCTLGTLDDAIRQVEEYEKRLRAKFSQFMEKLLSDGADIARAKIVEMDAIEDGELLESISTMLYKEGNRGIIFTDCKHACYVEFGTGIVGAASPHPTKPWAYDVNEHGVDGWYYYDEDQKRVRFTQGMPSRPFMYETARELERQLKRTAREVFRQND